jgi:hypothetical protein
MKIKLFIIVMLVSVVGWGQSIFDNPITFAAAIPPSPYTAGQTVNANITVSGISRGSGIAGVSAGNRYNANNWSTGVIDLTDYFEFTLTPNAGYQINFVNFVYTSQVSTGSPNHAFRSSLDGFTSNIGTPTTTGTTISLSAVAYQNITTAITFRIYTFGAAAGTTTFSINDFIFNGTVTSTTPQPDINVTGNFLNILNGDITPTTTDLTDYGNVAVGGNLGATFTIENLGPATLNIASITVTGSSAFAFASFYIPPTSITPAPSSNPLSISFNPTTNGLQTATVTITSDDPDEDTYTFNIQGNGTCAAPAVISTVFPASGPQNTEVTINASSGDLTGTTVTFNGTPAIIVSSTTTQLIVVVPAGATTGNINIIKTATGCRATVPFTVITKDVTSCQGTNITDLIIYEVHDQKTGSGGTITLFNGTATTKVLSNYRIYRTSNQNDGNEINYATLTGSIPSGGLAILRVNSGTTCGPAATNGTINGGFNENDGIQLRDGAGTTVIDDVDAYVPAAGYYMKRNVAGFIPRTSFNATDWTTITLASGVCASGLGTTPIIGGAAIAPVISAQPVLNLTCTSTNATINVTGGEGFAGGNPLIFQWFVAAPNTATWSPITQTGIYADTDLDPTNLNISPLTGLDGYQYYCELRENTATCFNASVAVKISTGVTQWNGGPLWTNGTPTLTKGAIINANYNTATNGNIDACSLNVISGVVTVTSGGYLNIVNEVAIGASGTIDILNNGSLVQDNDASVNTLAAGGNTFSRRDTSVKLQDYVYWSSPVSSYNVGNISPVTPASLVWEWNPVVANPNGGKGNWQNYFGAMTVGKGYIVRTPNIVPFNNATAQTFSTAFSGLFNNGLQTPTIQRGDISALTTTGANSVVYSNLADNWNLVGNPYPSAIRVLDFLAANTNIEGAVRLWTHNTLPISTTSPFYNTFVNNYTPNDYIVYNGTATTSGPAGFNGLIASGQAFFVVMNDGVAAASSTVTFINDMRSKTYDNGQFYKNAKEEKNSNGLENKEKHRIWLDIVSQTDETARTVIGYVDGATPAKDRMYDAYASYKPELNIFSLIGEEIMTIQGKSLPFINSDTVPLGIKVPTNGTYTIAINAVDGLFANNAQTIYLEDNLSNTIHNLSVTPYQFNTNQGIVNDRFVLRYTDAALANSDFEAVNNTVSVYGSNNVIKVNSSVENIKSYEVYDVLGRTLATNNNVIGKQSDIISIIKSNQALIVKVTLENGSVITKKIVF